LNKKTPFLTDLQREEIEAVLRKEEEETQGQGNIKKGPGKNPNGTQPFGSA